jgi:hypothetical protein
VLGCEVRNPGVVIKEHLVRQHEERFGFLSSHYHEGGVQPCGIVDIEYLQGHTQRLGGDLDLVQRRGDKGIGSPEEHGHMGDARHCLFQQF